MRKLLQLHLGKVLLLAAMVTGLNSWAQLTLPSGTSYSQNFNTTTLPTGWTTYSGATATSLGTSSSVLASSSSTADWASTTAGFKFSASARSPLTSTSNAATQFAATDRSLSVRTSGSFGDPGQAIVLRLANTTGKTSFTLNFDAQLQSVQGRTTTYRVDYFIGTPTTTAWTATGTTFTDLGINGGAWGTTPVSVNFGNALDNKSTNVYIRIVCTAASSGSGNRCTFGIDDAVLTWTDPSSSATPPTLTAAVGATVDNAFNVTFTDDATWRGAITAISVDGTTLAAGAYNKNTAGQITFTPSASTLLQTPSSKTIVVYATGYTNATVTQDIGVGAANKLVMYTDPTAPASNGAIFATQPEVKVADQYGNTITGSTATINAAANTSAGAWTLGGTTAKAVTAGTGIASYINLSATSSAAVTGASINFTSTGLTGITSGTFNIPAPVPANDACSGTVPLLTVGASATSGTLVAATASTYTNNAGYKDVWYRFTAGCSGTHSVTMNNFTGANGAIFVFPTSCPTTSTQAVTTTNGNTGNTGGTGVAETLTFVATQGTTYYVRIATTNGTEATFNVQVSSVAEVPTVGFTTPTGLGATGVTLHGTATATGCSSALSTTAGTYGFEYSTTNNFANGAGTVVASTDLSSGTFSGSISGLAESTTYYYKSFAENASGRAYSSQSSFTTSCVTPVAVTSLTPSYPATFQIGLSWTNGACYDEMIVVAKQGSAVTAIPSGDGTAYTANAAFGSGTAIAANEYVVFKGTGTSVTVTGLTTGSTYYFTVYTRKGTTWSSGVSTSGTAALVYCTPSYSTAGVNERVATVNLGTLSQTTATNPAPGYVNYTSTQNAVPDLTKGQTYNVTLTFGSNNIQYSAIWLDFNNDGTFATTEYFSLGTNAGASGTAVIPVTVPESAVLGNIRMRIRGGDDSALLSTHACGASASVWGQAQDFNVNILTNSLPIVTTTAASGTTSSSFATGGNVTSQGTSSVTARGVVYGTSTDPTLSNGVVTSGSGTGSFTSNVTGLADSTTYYARAYATNSSGTSYGPNITVTTTAIENPVATDATYLDAAGCGFNANWQAVTGATGYELEVATSNVFSGTNTPITETFEAGTLTNWQNTTNWTNATSGAITGSRSLRVNAPSSQSTQYTYTQPTSYDLASGTTTWRFNAQTAYSPSGNNYFYFYLISNNTNMGSSSTANGYVVGLRFTGSDNTIKLWKASNGSTSASVLITSSQSVLADVTYGIEVTRTKDGLWTLKTKSGGGFTSMTSAGTATDTSYTTTTYSGIVSTTSSSNNTNFRFDDFSIQNEFSNNLAGYNPKVISGGSVTSYAVSGLTEGNTYYYRVRSKAANSTSGNSNTITAVAKYTNFWNGTAWTAGVPPTSIDKAIIQGDYNTAATNVEVTPGVMGNGTFSAGQLTVNSGTFTIASSTNLTVQDNVVNNGDESNFIIENNGNLIQVNDVDNSGQVSVQKNSAPIFRLDYAMWSSPVAGMTLIGFSPETIATRFYHYNPISDEYAPVPGSTTFVEGGGYLIRVANTHPAFVNAETPGTSWHGTFVGTPNNGNVDVAVTPQGSGVQGYNAVGNPYPSPINIHAFYAANTSTIADASALYFWRKKNDAATGSYARVTKLAYTANTGNAWGDAGGTAFNGAPNTWVINPGQGFIVQATGSTVHFNNAMRVAVNNGQIFRTAQDDNGEAVISRLWLNLTGQDGFSQAAIGYTDMTTLGLDYGWDGKAFINDGDVTLFSLAGEETLGIQARPSFEVSDVVPMGYQATQAGNYTIALDHMDGVFELDQDIYLQDNLLNVTHDLKQGAYEFTTEAGVNTGRFNVIYAQPLSTDNPVLDTNSVIVYKDGNSININSGIVDMTGVSVYDTRGRLLYNGKDINSTTTVINGLQAEKQVLIVNIATTKGEVSKKIIF